MSVTELRARLSDPASISDNPFELMQELCEFANSGTSSEQLQELVLRALEFREAFGQAHQVLDALVRQVGLFPYIDDPDQLNLADRLAYEYHRPANMVERDIVFHRPQARVYRELLAGHSVILSAPTSFGKSLIVDAIVAAQKYRNILVIVPTIALIDETRRRLSTFAHSYKIITHPFQRPSERNIYVLTQERVLQHHDLDSIDFFVVDEFYKLSPTGEGEDRSSLLNQAFYELVRRGKQFYMLGPSITGILPGITERLEFKWISEPYHTVVSELHRVEVGPDELTTLVELCNSLRGQTIIFCRSVARASAVTSALIAQGVRGGSDVPPDALRWIASHYHPEWHFVKALEHGIGVHHGRIPRALAQYIVRAFDEGWVRFLVCTSTLIEGVNTKAENIVVLDDKIDRSRYDYFTFNNIRGRSGRMFSHFVGHVYLFNDPPPEELPFVDIPAFSQSANATDGLLIQLLDADLSESSIGRLQRFHDQPHLSYSVLKANVGVDPAAQLSLAEELASDLQNAWEGLSWRQFPSYEQLGYVCELMWRHFGGSRLGAGSVRSAAQLTFRISQLRDAPLPRALIASQIEYGLTPDAAVQSVLDFLRLWAGFHFPRLLRAIDRIQRDVFTRSRLIPGNFELLAARVENYYIDPALVALDEYGVPLELARRMGSVLGAQGDLDEVLEALRRLDVRKLSLTPFEADMLTNAQRYLGRAQ